MNKMNKRYDVIVIGAGLAGVQAALSAKNSQRNVLLITKGFGSFYYGSGVVDLLGVKERKMPVKPWASLDNLPGKHPYQIMGTDQVRQGIGEFVQLMEETGYPFIHHHQEKNFFLPTALGNIRSTYLAPLSLAQGDIRLGGKIKLFGLEGFHYFSPSLAASRLTKEYQGLGMNSEISFRILELGKIRPGPISVYDLALWLDDPNHGERLIKQILPQLGQEERIGFPAILGLENHRQVLAQIEERVGKKVFEIPTLPPSVPGIRLHQHLFKIMNKKGIDCRMGYPVIGAEVKGNRIIDIQVAVPGKNIRFCGEKYILATGGLGSDGLLSEPGRVKEPIFNLPIHQDHDVERWSRINLIKEQPYAHFGVRVDQKMRPVDSEGRICYHNLYAAGSILAYFDGIAERSMGGVDISTGFVAGKECGGEV